MDDYQIKEITGYSGEYYVTHTGEVFTKSGRNIKKHKLKNGYYVVDLHHNGKRKTEYIHRLVAKAFLLRPEGANTVNHKDFDRTNNNIENLEWVTTFENIRYSANRGRYKEPMKKVHKMNEKPVIGTCMKTGEKKFYESINSTEKDGFTNFGVSHCLRGDIKSHKGYTWEYVNKENKNGRKCTSC